MIKEHKLPTIIGLLVLIVGLVGGIFLVQTGQVFFLRAAPEITPTQVKITNLSSNSFSVSWLTDKETSGFVKFGESSSLERVALDDRDQMAGKVGMFNTHHVTLKNLKPNTHYLFKLGSENKLFDNSGSPYEIATPGNIANAPAANNIASGTVLSVNGTPAKSAVVYLNTANATPQSTLVRSDGSWFIPLNTALSITLTSYATYSQDQSEEIFVQGGQGITATAITTISNTNPVPEITLGKTYDFRSQASPDNTQAISPQPVDQATPPASKFSVIEIAPPTPASGTAQLTIKNPGKDNENVNTTKPEFTGTGPAGKTIQILVESSQPYSGTITVNKDGTWKWTPPANLSPGEHKVTLTYLGKTLTRTFTVLAAGQSEMPAFTATPSGSLTPSPTINLTPTPTTRLTPTPTSISLTPTSTASARTSIPSTQSGVPTSGDLTPTFIVSIMGLVLILSGFILKSRWIL